MLASYSCTIMLWPWEVSELLCLVFGLGKSQGWFVLSLYACGVSTACLNLAGTGVTRVSIQSKYVYRFLCWTLEIVYSVVRFSRVR